MICFYKVKINQIVDLLSHMKQQNNKRTVSQATIEAMFTGSNKRAKIDANLATLNHEEYAPEENLKQKVTEVAPMTTVVKSDQ